MTSYTFGYVDSAASSTGLFSTSYKAQQENSKKYYQDAVIEFTKKLNIALKKHTELRSLSDACGGCDVILPAFDEYLKANLPRRDYGVAVVQFFHASVSRNISSQTQKSLNDLIASMLDTIIEDTDYLIQTQHDIDAPGRYTDGDMSNSPYDLMDDMKKVLWILVKDPPEYEWYVNTMKNNAPGLITGRFETGQWAQGKTYEIDLASDVAWAFGQNSDGGSGWDSSSGQDCESGFCMTTDIIYNDQYSVSGDGKGFVSANFEEIFGSVNDWLIKKGDKRNIACKWPPPVNQYQSNNDQNLFFKNIFRGLGIFVFQKTPRFVEKDATIREKKTDVQKEKETDWVIAKSFKNHDIDTDNLMLYTQKQMVEEATPIARRAGDTAESQERAARIQKNNKNLQIATQTSQARIENGNPDESTKNMFRSFGSWVGSFGSMVGDTLDISKAWKDKPNCEN